MEELDDKEKLFVSKEKGNFSVAGFRLVNYHI